MPVDLRVANCCTFGKERKIVRVIGTRSSDTGDDPEETQDFIKNSHCKLSAYLLM